MLLSESKALVIINPAEKYPRFMATLFFFFFFFRIFFPPHVEALKYPLVITKTWIKPVY